MRFNLKGLTSSALVAKDGSGAQPSSEQVPENPATTANQTGQALDTIQADYEKGTFPSDHDPADSKEELNTIDTTAEQGVQNVQAMTFVWAWHNLLAAYILFWLVGFIFAFVSGSVSTLTPYVTSSFEQHSLTALTDVISSLIAGLWKLPYAKIMNIWGRPYALCIGVLASTIGLIMMAGCNNVQTYCAAKVFWYLGYNSVDFSMTVFIADTSKLKNRGLFIGYVASPWLITTWVYGYAVDRILAPDGVGFRWGFGIFSIFVPLTCLPVIAIMFRNEAKARKQGLIEPRRSHGTLSQTIVYYLKEFDVIGLLILATGLALFLLSFNIYSYQAEEWKSPMIICFIIFGALLVVAFGIWEKYFAPVTFVPWPLLKNRTVIFTYTMAGSLYIGWYIWDSYFYSLLVVLFNQPVVYATYIMNTYTMGSCFISIVYGILLRYYGRLKLYSLFWGVPLTLLGAGLMIAFRQPDVNIGYIVMCQIFIALGGGVLVISEQTTLMAVSKQQDFPPLLACESMIIAIGSAIGSTIAGALWTGIFPKRLMANLPASAIENFAAIYGELETQLSYAVGTPARDAINLSYAQTQRYMLITATCIYVITWVSVMFWQDVDIAKMKQRTVGLI